MAEFAGKEKYQRRMRAMLARIFNGIKRWAAWIVQPEYLPREPLPAAQKPVSFLAWLFAGERLESAPAVERNPDRRNFWAWIASPQKLDQLPAREPREDHSSFLPWLLSPEKLEKKPERGDKETNFLKWIFKRETL